MTDQADIAIIGAGAIGQAFAIDLLQRGFSVPVLVETAAARAEALRRAAVIRLSGHMGEAERPMPRVEAAAVSAAEALVILVATTVDAHRQVARDLAGVLTDDHIVLLANGYVNGSQRFAASLRAGGCTASPAVLELSVTPYLVCSPAPGRVHVTARKRWMELSSFEPERAARHHPLIARIVPGVTACDNALASALNNQNPIAHVPSHLMNAAVARDCALVEPDATRGGAFYLEDYSSPEVLALRAAADAERIAVMHGLGLGDLAIPRAEFSLRSYGPGTREAVSPRMGRTFARRFVTEDIPFGLLPIERLGRAAGVETPVISGMITLIGVLEGRDWRGGEETP